MLIDDPNYLMRAAGVTGRVAHRIRFLYWQAAEYNRIDRRSGFFPRPERGRRFLDLDSIVFCPKTSRRVEDWRVCDFSD